MPLPPGGFARRFGIATGIAVAIWCTPLLFGPTSVIPITIGPIALGNDETASDVESEVRAATEQMSVAFNEGKAVEVAAMFLPRGELVDDEGTVYQGREEIADLLTAFFEAFPGAQGEIAVEVVRQVAPQLVMEEGRRSVTGGKEAGTAHHRYVAVRMLDEGTWKVASLREISDDPPPTPRDYLEPLAWLEGEWLSEGSEAAVKIAFHWSDDGHFLLGEYEIGSRQGFALKTSQRIGWDAVAGRIRSWLFDSDGAFSEGQWAQVEDSWIIKSVTALPDGLAGSATITLTPLGPHRFRMQGTDRVVGNVRGEDFNVEVTRHPPAAAP